MIRNERGVPHIHPRLLASSEVRRVHKDGIVSVLAALILYRDGVAGRHIDGRQIVVKIIRKMSLLAYTACIIGDGSGGHGTCLYR
jgi:hypothetical protein